jgi:hypothetical protein
MNVVRYNPCRARSPNGRDIENGAILDRLDLWRELVLVAILLEVAIELNGFKKLMAFRPNFVIFLAQPKCASTRLRSWVANAIFIKLPPLLWS